MVIAQLYKIQEDETNNQESRMGQRIHVVQMYIFSSMMSHYSPEYSKPIEAQHDAQRVDIISRKGSYGNIAK
jgi:hypothetical protein